MADLSNRSFTAFAGLRPNQGSALGLSPGEQADLVTIAGPNGAKFTVARKVAPQFSAFLSDLTGKGYALNPKTSGGYNDRTIAGSNRISQHAFGNAIDLNWDINPRGSAKHDLPTDVGDMANKHGLVWGGTFSNPDPMHFEASRIVDGLPAYAAPSGGETSMPAGSGYLRQALNAAGAVPGPAQPTVGGDSVQLTAPNMRYSKLADALLASAAGAKPKGWGDLLNSAGDAALGYTLAGKADKEQGAYKSSLSQALLGANDTDAMARTLMSSGDEDLVKQGVALKVAQNKPREPRFHVDEKTGAVWDLNTGKQVTQGTAKPEEKKYQFTKYGVGDPTTGEIKPYAEGEGGDVEYNKNLTYGVDEDNNVVPLQAGNNATIARSKLPPGVKINGKDPIRLDIGTEFVLLDPVTRQVIGRVPKDVAGEAAQKKIGEGQGERAIAQPATNANMRNSLSGLKRLTEEARGLKGMEGVESMTGVFQGSGWVPTVRQDTANAEARLTTLKSQIAFNVLQAMRDASKTGGALGAVSEKELALLENNLASLETQQGTKAFQANLERVAEYAEGAMQRLNAAYRDTYGQHFDQSAAPPPAAGGDKVLRYNPATGKLE